MGNYGKPFQAYLAESVETGDKNCNNLLNRVLPLREQHNLQNAVFCEESFGKNHALYAHRIFKDVESFLNWSVHEFYS